MKEKHIKLFVALWTPLCLLLFFGGCMKTFKGLVVPKPISKKNMPGIFNVVGITRLGKPLLLLHESTEYIRKDRNEFRTRNEFKKYHSDSERPILWDEDNRSGGPYTLYINANERQSVESALTRSFGERARYVKIQLLEDNPKSKTQKVSVTYHNDDFTYYSIYRVQNGKAVPVEYGDMVKADLAAAASITFPWLLLALIVGWVAAWIARRIVKHKEN